jgi:hypothetical protein
VYYFIYIYIYFRFFIIFLVNTFIIYINKYKVYNIPKLFCDRIASAIDKQKVNEAEGQKQDWLCKARNIILTEPTILAEAAELNESGTELYHFWCLQNFYY